MMGYFPQPAVPGRSVPPVGSSDPFWANVLLLLGNNQGPNGNNVTNGNGPDQSNFARTVTVTGTPTWTTANAPAGLTTTIDCDGTESLSVPDSADWAFTGDFCVETFTFTAITTGQRILCIGDDSGTPSRSLILQGTANGGANSIGVFLGTTAEGFELEASTVALAMNASQWTYTALYRTGANLYAAVGLIGGTTTTLLLNAAASGTIANVAVGLGYGNGVGATINGWLGQLAAGRISNVARYGAAGYATPTLPLPTATT